MECDADRFAAVVGAHTTLACVSPAFQKEWQRQPYSRTRLYVLLLKIAPGNASVDFRDALCKH